MTVKWLKLQTNYTSAVGLSVRWDVLYIVISLVNQFTQLIMLGIKLEMG